VAGSHKWQKETSMPQHDENVDPIARLIEQVTGLEDRFFHLRVVKPFYRACTELLIGSLAHPTLTKNVFLFIRGGTSSQDKSQAEKGLRITIP
jgi:hypothetical protein